MNGTPTRFNLLARILHWTMALLVLVMLFIGVKMVASLHHYSVLIAIHRPLGILILVLAIVRLTNRLLTHAPPLPATVRQPERFVALATEWLMYALLMAMPLIGWGMLSAGQYPIVLWGSVHLPAILPASPMLYANLRRTHTLLAYLLFFAVLGHLSAILFHTLIVRDGMLSRMTFGNSKKENSKTSNE